MRCPHCKKTISNRRIAKHWASLGGKSKSDLKAAAARENGKKGGRPKNEPI